MKAPLPSETNPGLHLLRCAAHHRERFVERGYWPAPLTEVELRTPSVVLEAATQRYVHEHAYFDGTIQSFEGTTLVAHGDIPIAACRAILEQQPAPALVTSVTVNRARVSNASGEATLGTLEGSVAIIAGIPPVEDWAGNHGMVALNLAFNRMERFCAANPKLPKLAFHQGQVIDLLYEPANLLGRPLDSALGLAELGLGLTLCDLAIYRALACNRVSAALRADLRKNKDVPGGHPFGGSEPGLGELVRYLTITSCLGLGLRAYAPRVRWALEHCLALGVFDGLPRQSPLQLFEEEEGNLRPAAIRAGCQVFLEWRLEQIESTIWGSLGDDAEAVREIIRGRAARRCVVIERFIATRANRARPNRQSSAAVKFDQWQPPAL